VIHAGIYYDPQLLKARLCIDGKLRLYRFCTEFGVPFRQCGKLIVATSKEQLPKLLEIKANGEANGLTDLRLLDAEATTDIESEIRCVNALLSPSTGIIDSHAFLLALQGDAEAHGAVFAFRSSVRCGSVNHDGIVLEIDGAEPMEIAAANVINAAGLDAQRVARSIEGMPAQRIPPLFLAKGNYFSVSAKAPAQRLIYPVPQAGGLGVHLTIDLAGQCRVGPDVEWVEEIDYGVDPSRAAQLYDAVRLYWPSLPDRALLPGYAGIRPKIAKPGGSDTDFVVQGRSDHGVPGLINLFGIESPGLTSSLAIAALVGRQVAMQAFEEAQ
jgi:L-2-hydroxyglutarate oxidase LhgO